MCTTHWARFRSIYRSRRIPNINTCMFSFVPQAILLGIRVFPCFLYGVVLFAIALAPTYGVATTIWARWAPVWNRA